MLLKCCIHYVSKFVKLCSGHRIGKNRSSSQFPRRTVLKKYANHWTIALISYASKVMLKILQARLQHYMNEELLDVQAEFRKGRGTRGQISNIH